MRADADQIDRIKQEAATLRSHDLRASQLSVLELLLAGYFFPLTGYLGSSDCISVIASGHLSDGTPWPLPTLLEVPESFAAKISCGDRVALRDPEGVLLAVMTVCEVWSSADLPAPAANELATLGQGGGSFLGGSVMGVEPPVHYDFSALRLNGAELRAQYVKRGWRKILACQPTDMIHRAEAARIVHAARIAQASVLVQVLATEAQTVTLAHYTRIRCLEHSLRYLPERSAILTVMPRPDSPGRRREVLSRAVLARGAGATHLLVEPEWWKELDAEARTATAAEAREFGIELVDLPHFVRDNALDAYLPVAHGPEDPVVCQGATEDILRRVRAGLEVPAWMSFPEVVEELRRSHPVRGRQGVTVFFTGLSGAGKSTIARVLLAKLLEIGERTVSLLDGDIVRKHLSSELGFSREHRDLNIQRIGFVASEITKHGGIAICAPIAPYRETRRKVRRMIEEHGGFVEVHVATPLETCEARDRKGLYAKARAGLIKEFTGISDPYESPDNAELVIDTRDWTPLEAAQTIITKLEAEGYVG